MTRETLPMRGLNHISRVCKDVEATAAFYRELLGFVDIRRPAFNFEGAWLYSPHCSVGVHLIKGQPVERSPVIDPKADHLSFLCASLVEVEEALKKNNVEHVKQCVIEEDGIRVTQIFFHDPENNMIEICNCDEFPVEPLAQPACTTCNPHWEMAQANSHATADCMPQWNLNENLEASHHVSAREETSGCKQLWDVSHAGSDHASDSGEDGSGDSTMSESFKSFRLAGQDCGSVDSPVLVSGMMSVS